MPIFLFSIIFWSNILMAYIPSSSFIFDKVASLHGRGAYLLEQDVLFQQGSDSLPVKESWLIVDGSEMRLVAQGPGFKTVRLFKKGRIYWLDENQAERADEPSADFFMPALLMRTPADLKKFFIGWKVLNPDILKDKKPYKDLKEIKHEPEKMVRLGRVGGAIAYAFGVPAPLGGHNPGVWVQQDEFVIRKMRTPSGAEIVNSDFAPFSRGFWYPKTKNISFGTQMIAVKLTKLHGIEMTNEKKKLMDPIWFRSNKTASTQWPSHGLSGTVKEFYTRFR